MGGHIKLLKVYHFTKNAHKNQKRKTGEKYITHPVAVAKICKKYDCNKNTLAACILHDVVEDTYIKLEDIQKKFGEEIAFLVDGVTKCKEQKDTINKIKEYSKKDRRVLLIKLADRLHNQLTINDSELFKKTIKKYRISTPEYIKLGMQYKFYKLANMLEKTLK